MDEDRAGTVREWNSRSVEGHEGLRRLASEEFSGVIETDRGSIRAFMTNGKVVGIDRGGIDDLDGMTMTAYRAPDDAIPLLFAMQERGGEPRAQYYTEETPISEVNRTLEEGGFTGYIELSENVLSGDYYVVYHGGRSSSVAFVGSSSRLVTGDEAFERADDEVGIYDVVDVDVPVIDVPGAGGEDAAPDDGGVVAGTGTGTERTPDPDAGEPDGAADPTTGTGETPAGTGGRSDASSAGTASERGRDEGRPGADGSGTGTSTGSAGASAGSDRSGGRSVDAGGRGAADGSTSGGGGPYGTGEEIRVGAGLGIGGDDDEDRDEDQGPDPDPDPDTDTTGRGSGTRTGDPGEAPPGPSADAPATEHPPDDTGRDRPPRDAGPDGAGTAPDDPDPDPDPEPDSDAGRGDRSADAGTDVPRGAGPDDRPADAGSDAAPDATGQSDGGHGGEAGPANGRAGGNAGTAPGPSAGAREGGGTHGGHEPATGPTRDRLAAELDEAREALERVRAERDDYRDDAERLRERVATLEERIEALEADDSAGAGAGAEADAAGADADADADAAERTLSPDEALAGTNLFVRYRSKSEPTLETAHGGNVDPGEVNRNLRIEQHTRFEAAGLVVDGEPFDSFLTSTFEYQFVEWVIRDLLYELRSTGNRASMEQLYDAIPAIDRVQFDGEVQVGDGLGPDGDAGGGEAADAREFDVILRDRMGGPLLVANLHESRDPTPAGDVTTLIEDARTVAATAETIGAAFVVTTSYYEPQALDAASSATGGGFLSRSRKESYVKMDRKRGFHLCLVEARDGDFNLRIPEL